MGRARRRGLAEEAADCIREAIFAGRFPPGAPLREVELAAALDISRGSVREGLAVLAREGLIRSAWHRGTKIIDVTADEAEEVYAVRAALERLAARLAAERATEEQIAELNGIVDTMAAELAEGADGPRLLAFDLEFHDRIYRLAGNRRLYDGWEGVRSQVRLFQLTRVRLGYEAYRAIVVDEHRELVRLIGEGDIPALQQAAEEHVLSACRALCGQLAGMPGPEE
ncbi:GntR family transcriptional regulator [Streptomyces sp. ISL-98]|uniref:GntR family transcriptional regulator n=1 Tax=Streptomyces sp. ISL-98 TaxID=2819192 RepID=UPI0027E4592C|nr:GntR family transcriptional regulator [Streptomyces sp. ISL-98]